MIAPATIKSLSPTPTPMSAKAAPPIHLQDASIKTVSVEIKALTIGKKQMTLSVFRQLPEEELIHWDQIELTGNPWGTVNYFHGECASAPRHLHVVWEGEGTLFRSCIYSDYKELAAYRNAKCRMKVAAAEWVTATLLSGSADEARDWWKRYARLDAITGGYFVMVWVGEQSSQVCEHDLKEIGGFLTDYWPIAQLEAAMDQSRLQEPPRSPDETWQTLEQEAGRLEFMPFDWAAIYAELERLDQLFIAV